MDEETTLLLYVVEIVASLIAIVYGGVLVWLIRKLLRLEEKQGDGDTEVAVLANAHKHLEEEFRRMDKRNEISHENFDRKLDDHNDRVMRRFDALVGLVKNGSK